MNTQFGTGLAGTSAFGFEVLTSAELDAVAGGDLSDSALDADGCSCTVSQCHIDGNNEPGTS